MCSNMTFIQTDSIEVAEKLRKLGFKEVSNTSPFFYFLNDIEIQNFDKPLHCI